MEEFDIQRIDTLTEVLEEKLEKHDHVSVIFNVEEASCIKRLRAILSKLETLCRERSEHASFESYYRLVSVQLRSYESGYIPPLGQCTPLIKAIETALNNI